MKRRQNTVQHRSPAAGSFMCLAVVTPRCLLWKYSIGLEGWYWSTPCSSPHLALFPKAKLSTLQERVEGFTGNYLELEDVDARDTMIIVSISGRNAGVVDMALEAKKIGMKVVALVSKQFASSTTSRHSSGKNLMDLADVVIDIKCVAGDAVLELDGLEPHFCGTSTVLGMAVMEPIVAQTVENCIAAGYTPPIYVSSNLDKGDAINDEHIRNYSKLISCL